MEILSSADKPKDIVSKEYVDGQIKDHVHNADDIPCSTKILKLGDTEYKISENLQKALENLLDYIYMNASGVLDLQTNLKSVSDTVKKIPAYKGGTGISIAGDTIGHSNNTLPGMVGTGEILTPDFGDTVYTTWFSYDAQGHVTQSGTGGFKIPTAETELDTKSANPIANSKATSEINRLDSRINSKADMTYAVSLAEKIDAKANASELAKVATSGSYNDLKDKPEVTANVTSGDGSLITSGGVYSKLYQYRPMFTLPGTSGSTGYVCFAELKVAGNYVNAPIEFKISSRGRFICNVAVRFANKDNTDPDIETLSFCGQDYKIYAYKSATSTWRLYALKSENYDSINVLATYRPGQFNGTITYPGTFAATKHTGTATNPVVDSTWGYKVGTAINANTWDGHTTAQTVLFTAESDVKSATIDGLFTKYTLIWAQFVGSKTSHTHIIPLAYLKSKGNLVFKDSGVPFNILYVSDTQIRWFDIQASGAESYTSVTIVKII